MQTRVPVRSYVVRGGRTTPAQARALDALWPVYGVVPKPEQELQPEALFGNDHPVVLDIGFGNGESTVHAALARPDENILGIEVHQPGVGALLKQLDQEEIQNVRIIRADAKDILRHHITPDSLAAVRLYFPDPWPKKRHHKRRLVQPDFVDLVAGALVSGGQFHLATDWEPYAEHMLETLEKCSELVNLSDSGNYVPRPAWRPITRFERRGMKYEQPARDLLFTKTE